MRLEAVREEAQLAVLFAAGLHDVVVGEFVEVVANRVVVYVDHVTRFVRVPRALVERADEARGSRRPSSPRTGTTALSPCSEGDIGRRIRPGSRLPLGGEYSSQFLKVSLE